MSNFYRNANIFYVSIIALIVILITISINSPGPYETYETESGIYEKEQARIDNLPDKEFFAYYDKQLKKIKLLATKQLKKREYFHPKKEIFKQDS